MDGKTAERMIGFALDKLREEQEQRPEPQPWSTEDECRACYGTGLNRDGDDCRFCQGTGNQLPTQLRAVD